MKRLAQKKILWLILAAFSALTIYHSIVLPLGEADDETDHYQYLRFVARTGHPPLTEAERREAGFKGGLAPLYYWLTAWPVALVGESARPDIRRVDARPERHLPTDGLGFNHVLHTLDEQWPWRGQPLAWHLVRLLSLPLGLVTIGATYALARRLWPGEPAVALGAAAFVAFLPRFVFSSAVINDDNLVFALAALLLLAQVIMLQTDGPPSAKMMALLGALFGLALVAKYFSLILLPEVALTLAVVTYRATGPERPNRLFSAARWLLPFGLALLLTAGGWFAFIALRFNRVEQLGWLAGLAAALGEPQITEGLAGLLAGHSVRPVAATYPLPAWLGLLGRSFWFEFGWMNVFAPAWVYWLLAAFSLLALLGLVRWIAALRRLKNWPVAALLGLRLALFMVVVLARYILSATIDTGQGRHLYPALPVIALLVAVGVYNLRMANSEWRIVNGVLRLAVMALFCLPALISLLPSFTVHYSPFTIDQLSRYISPHYHTHPVTTAPAELPADRRLNLEFATGLSLLGFDAPAAVAAGSALPVTLVWQARRQSTADYLLELCLTAPDHAPAACWRGNFEDGRYPARAWEPGDTLLDTVYVPVPACSRLFTEQNYQLELTVWALNPAAAVTQPETPVLSAQLPANIQITPNRAAPPPAELWLGPQRLTAPAAVTLGQSLTQISYLAANAAPAPRFTATNGARWLPQHTTALQLPCADGSAQVDQFVVSPNLPAGDYRAGEPALPGLTLNLRPRVFAPVTATLTFSRALAPLQLTAGGQSINLAAAPAAAPRLVATAGGLPVTIRWQAIRRQAGPLVVALKLLDKDFAVGGERIATLGDRYPSLLWSPGEVVEETYPLRFNPAAPPGLYRLELGLIRQDAALPDGYEKLPALNNDAVLGENLYPLTVRLPDPAQDGPPPNAIAAQVGDSIRLAGFAVNRSGSDSPEALELALYWQSAAAPAADYTVFTQLIGPDGQVWAQWDNPPQAGRYPTLAWSANDTVIDRYTLTRRAGAPAGEYRLLVGMYNPATGTRLPARVNGQLQPDNAIPLTTVVLP